MTWIEQDLRVLSRIHISRELRVFGVKFQTQIFVCVKNLTFHNYASTAIASSQRSQENLDTCNPRFWSTKNWSPKKKVEVHWLRVTQGPILLKLIIIQVRAPPPPPVRPTQPPPAWTQPQLQNPTWLSSTTGWTHPFLADWTFLQLRIPKTGSENMAFIIKKLSRQNNFNQKRFSRNGRGSLTEMELRRLEGSVCGKLSQPTIFDEHIHFLPTSESCRNPVSWITMVGK